MNANGLRDPDNDQHGETCFEEGHVPFCPGRAGGEHMFEDAEGYLRTPLSYELHEDDDEPPPWSNREGMPEFNGAFR
jgi:hypothetical protein